VQPRNDLRPQAKVRVAADQHLKVLQPDANLAWLLENDAMAFRHSLGEAPGRGGRRDFVRLVGNQQCRQPQLLRPDVLSA
jgi:hypothetical protein